MLGDYYAKNARAAELNAVLGSRWAICRNTPKNRERYGRCITRKQYDDAVNKILATRRNPMKKYIRKKRRSALKRSPKRNPGTMWKVIINGKDSGIWESNHKFAKDYWARRARLTGKRIKLVPKTISNPGYRTRPTRGEIDKVTFAFYKHKRDHKGWSRDVRINEIAAKLRMSIPLVRSIVESIP